MTKTEKVKIEQAIKLLGTDNGYEDAMVILLSLLGHKHPVVEIIKNAKSVSVTEIKIEGPFIFK